MIKKPRLKEAGIAHLQGPHKPGSIGPCSLDNKSAHCHCRVLVWCWLTIWRTLVWFQASALGSLGTARSAGTFLRDFYTPWCPFRTVILSRCVRTILELQMGISEHAADESVSTDVESCPDGYYYVFVIVSQLPLCGLYQDDVHTCAHASLVL